jgi:hypothetical protein
VSSNPLASKVQITIQVINVNDDWFEEPPPTHYHGFMVKVKNLTAKTLVIGPAVKPLLECEVLTSKGKSLWKKALNPIMGMIILRPNGVKKYLCEWNHRDKGGKLVPHGATYWVRGNLLPKAVAQKRLYGWETFFLELD